MRTSKKSQRDFSAEASALPALIVGNADNSHSCADRSVFCLGRAEAKNGLKCPLRVQNLLFAAD